MSFTNTPTATLPVSGTAQFSRSAASRLVSIRLAAVTLAMFCVSISGFGGCREESSESQARAKKEAQDKKSKEAADEKKKRPDYEIGPPVPQPAESGQALLAKPGHWITASQLMTANYSDFVGKTTLRVYDKQRQPLPVPRTPYTLSATRPVALVKGRAKSIDSTFYIPPAEEEVRLQATLRERNSGRRIDPPARRLTLMPAYQYHVVVLAKEPARYTFLKTLNSFKAPVDSEDSSDDTLHYRVLLPDISRRVPLPDGALCWSSIAYIVWDEVDPQQLSEVQRTALIDWLHWGGQLWVSGPDSLDLLKGSSLAAYLPADGEGARTIDSDDLGPMSREWTKGRGAKPLAVGTPWSGVRLRLRPEGQPVSDTGDLLMERRVGRGRVVVSAFQLAERDLLAWGPSLDHFVNSALLRHDARVFSRGPYDELHVNWAGKPEHRLDAAFTSKLRFFTRDTHDDPSVTNYRTVDVPAPPASIGFAPANADSATRAEVQPPLLPGGVAGWNDISAPAVAAATALREAAGVQVPDATFVLVRLGLYLLVLVPLNWAVFQSLGRVEWAWVAAPLIALAGTWIVVKQAQLDIGFVRAQTEIAVLELQPNYPRGHLTRYTGLYTSLSTTYELAYDDPSTLAAPFPAGEILPGQSIMDVAFSQQDKVRLSNLEVTSASTRMIHSEEVTPAIGGRIVLGKSSLRQEQIENHSDLHLRSVALIRRASDKERLDVCWIGELRPGASAILYFNSDDTTLAKKREEEMKGLPLKLLNLEPLFKVACDPRHLEPGEERLVGRVDEILPGSAVTPTASQTQGATLVVAHLKYGPLPNPAQDDNSPLDVLTQK